MGEMIYVFYIPYFMYELSVTLLLSYYHYKDNGNTNLCNWNSLDSEISSIRLLLAVNFVFIWMILLKYINTFYLFMDSFCLLVTISFYRAVLYISLTGGKSCRSKKLQFDSKADEQCVSVPEWSLWILS